VLGKQPRSPGSVLAGHCPAWPATRGEQVTKPSGVVLVDPLPLRGDLVREPGHVLSLGLRDQSADPLVFVAPSQQFPPEFFVHANHSSPPCLTGERA
jgi:hypothetical protein